MQAAANDRESDSMSSISSLSDVSNDEKQDKKSVTKKKRSTKTTSGNKRPKEVGKSMDYSSRP